MTQKELNEILKGPRPIDLSGQDLIELDLRNADLAGANLSRADLREADLSEADLRGSYLIEADLSGAHLRGSYLIEADLSEADLWKSDLSGAKLSRADLREANIFSFQFQQHTLYYTGLNQITIGCFTRPIEYWFENARDIGRSEGYTETQIELYIEQIKICQRLYDAKKEST